MNVVKLNFSILLIVTFFTINKLIASQIGIYKDQQGPDGKPSRMRVLIPEFPVLLNIAHTEIEPSNNSIRAAVAGCGVDGLVVIAPEIFSFDCYKFRNTIARAIQRNIQALAMTDDLQNWIQVDIHVVSHIEQVAKQIAKLSDIFHEDFSYGWMLHFMFKNQKQFDLFNLFIIKCNEESKFPIGIEKLDKEIIREGRIFYQIPHPESENIKSHYKNHHQYGLLRSWEEGNITFSVPYVNDDGK